MAGQTVKEWDESGNPVQSQVVQEWDEHGNPVSSPRQVAPIASGQNPVQDVKSQLASAWQTALGGYPAEIASGISRGATNMYDSLGNLLRPRNPNEVQYGPTGRALLHLGQDIGGGLSNAYQASKQSQRSGEGLAGQALAFGENAPIVGGMVRKAEEGGTKMFSPQSVGAAAEGSVYAAAPYAAEKGVSAVANLPADVVNYYKVRQIQANEGIPVNEATRSATSDALTKVMKQAKQRLWDTHNVISQRVGKFVQDAVAPDYAAGEPQISTSDVGKFTKDTFQKYNAKPGDMPNFEKVSEQISNMNPQMYLEQMLNLRTQLGRLWNRLPDGADSAAVKDLRDWVTDKAKQRVDELGPQSQRSFGLYNKEWKTLMDYEDRGPLGNLLNKTTTGYDFFKVLKDTERGGELARSLDSLEAHGLPKNFKKTLLDKHGTAYDYLNATASAGTGIGGKLKTLLRHPVAAVTGATAGGLAGSVGGPVGKAAGAYVGLMKAGKLADTLEGIRALRATGVPSRVGELRETADIQPSGQSVVRPERPSSVKPSGPDAGSVNDLTRALRDQGVDAKTAKALAIQAVRDNPNDFNAALRQALRGTR